MSLSSSIMIKHLFEEAEIAWERLKYLHDCSTMIQSCSFDFLEKQEGLVFHYSIPIFGSDSSKRASKFFENSDETGRSKKISRNS